jgi:hypothetical protein
MHRRWSLIILALALTLVVSLLPVTPLASTAMAQAISEVESNNEATGTYSIRVCEGDCPTGPRVYPPLIRR